MEREWHERKLAGNEAENIFEYLIGSLQDWECYRFGIENHIQELRQAVRNRINSTTRKIKSMPDYVVINSKTDENFFVEVKFRSSFINAISKKPEYKIKFLEEYKIYWPGTRLVVLQDYAPCIFSVNLDLLEDKRCTRVRGETPKWDFEGVKEEIGKIFPGLKQGVLAEVERRISRKSRDEKI